MVLFFLNLILIIFQIQNQIIIGSGHQSLKRQSFARMLCKVLDKHLGVIMIQWD